MKLPCLIFFVSLGAHATESYIVGGDVQASLNAYSRSANFRPLKPSMEDELRIWTQEPMTGRVEGYIISRKSVIRCNATSHYMNGIVTIDRARCRPWHKGKYANSSLDVLFELDGKEWDCEILDGYELYAEGVRGNRKLAFRVGNPDGCDDPGSKAVARLINDLW